LEGRRTGTADAGLEVAMTSRFGAFLLLGLTAAGCEAPTAPGDRGLLAEARDKWRAQNQDSYSFELNRNCFCVLGGRRMTVTVRAGLVVAADYLDTSGPVDAALLSFIPTVPDLFDLIDDALNRQVASFLAEYDPTFGYPTRIEVDYSATTADDEIAFSVRNLVFQEASGP
jgi:uncharacterized protein DUF6174